LLKAVTELGIAYGDRWDASEKFVTDIGRSYVHELAIVLKKSEGLITYLGTQLRKRADRKYLFREKKGNFSVPFSLTLRDAGKGAGPIVEKFINFGCKDAPPLARNVSKVLEENRARLVDELEKLPLAVQKNERKFYTVVIECNGEELYPGEIDEFRDVFLRRVSQEAKDYDGTCYLCGLVTRVGHKASDIFKFSSFDKPGFAYMINDANYYINLPVCRDCFANLSVGKKIMDSYLNLNFYASNVYIIPRFVGGTVSQKKNLKSKIETVENLKNLKDALLRDDNPYKTFELYALEYLKARDIYTTFNFVFYTLKNNEMKIHLSIMDVPPSVIESTRQAKKTVERQLWPLFSTRDYQPEVLLKPLYQAFSGNRVKSFFDYVEAVFKGKSISLAPLKKAVLDSVASRKLKGEKFATFAKQLLTVCFFIDRVTNRNEGGEERVASTWEELLENHFTRYSSFFKTSEEKLAFVIGMIHARISQFQRAKGVSSTVDLKVKAYNMRPTDFRNHLLDLKWKLTQYRKTMDEQMAGPIYRLLQIAGKYLVDAGKDWRTSVEDLNYSFLAGEISSGVLRKPQETESQPEEGEGGTYDEHYQEQA